MSSSTNGLSEGRIGLLATLIGPLPPRTTLERQLDIDAARGIAILLVVIGHVVSTHGEVPADNQWYLMLRHAIYSFHMPLFMFLTGISFALSLPHFGSYLEIASYSRAKVLRLLVPYICFGLIITLGKLVAANYMHIDNRPKGSFDDIIALFVNPGASAAGFLWFIYVLGLYFIVIPAFLQATSRRPVILFMASIVAQSISWPDEFMLNAAFTNLPFLSAGMLLWLYRTQWLRIDTFAALMYISVFVAALALAPFLGFSKWFVGALSVPAVLSIAQYAPRRIQSNLARLGQLTLSIYLMSSVIMGLAKALMLKLFPWDGIYFLIYFSVMVLSGMMIPVLIKNFASRHIPAINRFI